MNTSPKSTPIAMAVQACCGAKKVWPMAKAMKKGDHTHDETMPRITASAAARRRDAGASGPTAADISAKAPVLMTPPNTWAAICWPAAAALAGSRASLCCVRCTEGIFMAVARTSAMVGRSAANTSARPPPSSNSRISGGLSRIIQATTPRTARITSESIRSLATVRIMNAPKAQVPVSTMSVPCASNTTETRAASQAAARQSRRTSRHRPGTPPGGPTPPPAPVPSTPVPRCDAAPPPASSTTIGIGHASRLNAHPRAGAPGPGAGPLIRRAPAR